MNENNKISKRSKINMRSKNYVLKERLGKGAHGMVHRVKSKENDKIYAMKIVNLKKFVDSTKEKLMNEGKILGSLSHKNIVMVIDSFIEKDKLYLVMEYAKNKDIHQVVKQHKAKGRKISENEVWNYIKGMLQGLNYLRDQNILHRDIKPANIFLTKDNIPKIGDFGISLNMNEEPNPYLVGNTCGTPLFYAPEMYMKKKYSYKIDVWALGCVSYYICNQTLPFKGKELRKLGSLIVNKAPKEIDNFYSSRLRGFIMLMLEKKKNMRPSVKELIDILGKGISISDWIQNKTEKVGALNENKTEKKKQNLFFQKFNNFGGGNRFKKKEKIEKNIEMKKKNLENIQEFDKTPPIYRNKSLQKKMSKSKKVIEEESFDSNFDIFNIRKKRKKSFDYNPKKNKFYGIKVNPAIQRSSLKLEKIRERSFGSSQGRQSTNSLNIQIKNNLERAIQPQVHRILDLKSRDRLSGVFDNKKSNFARRKKITVKDIKDNSYQKIPHIERRRSDFRRREHNPRMRFNQRKNSRGRKSESKKKHVAIESLIYRSRYKRDRSEGDKPSKLLVQEIGDKKRPISSYSIRGKEFKKSRNSSFGKKIKKKNLNISRKKSRSRDYAIHKRVKPSMIRNMRKEVVTTAWMKGKEEEENSGFDFRKKRIRTDCIMTNSRERSFGGGLTHNTHNDSRNSRHTKSFFRKIKVKPKNIKILMRPSSAMHKRLTIKDL